MTNAFAESAARHRARAEQMLAELDDGRDATKFSGGQAVMGLAHAHALLGILDALTAQEAAVCGCPSGMEYHANNCSAFPAPAGGGGLLAGPGRPVGGTSGWPYPAAQGAYAIVAEPIAGAS